MSLLGVDLGTSGCRAVAFSPAGSVLASAERAYGFVQPAPLRAEQDGDVVWESFRACLVEVNAALADDPVEALACAVQGEAVGAVGANGELLAPVPLSFDYRAGAEADELGARFPGLRCTAGQSVHAMSSIFKIAWWIRHEPAGAGAADRFCCYGDLVALRLGLEPAIDYTMASRTGAFDVGRACWNDELLAAIGLDEGRLSRPVPCGAPLGRIAGPTARELGFATDPLVVAGAHDQAAAAWGAGVARAGQASLSLGTSECLTGAVEDAPAVLAGSPYSYYRPFDDGEWLVLAGLPASGSMLRWFVDQLAGDERLQATDERSAYDLVDERLADDSGGVLVLPHFAGSGTIDDDALSTGAIVGLTLGTTRAQIARALVEASGFEAARNLEAWAAAGTPMTEVRVSGGGARSARALSVRATALGRPLLRAPRFELATCRGAALLSGIGAGVYASLADACGRIVPDTAVEPDAARSQALREARRRYSRLHSALRALREASHPDDGDPTWQSSPTT